jgi:hypothetical protein
MEIARPFEMLVSYHITTLCHNPEEHGLKLHPEDGYCMALRNAGNLRHDVTNQKNMTSIFTLKMEAARIFEIVTSYHITTRCHEPKEYESSP